MNMRIKILDRELYYNECRDGFAPQLDGDAGIDLRATEDREIGLRETATIPLGVAVELPEDSVGWLTGRSSSTLAFGVLSHEGKIDAGYRGEVHAMLTALERRVFIRRGERIAQLVVVRIHPPTGWEETDNLSETLRGKAGLGSTGRT